MTRLAALLAALLLSGCGSVRSILVPTVQIVRERPPAELLECAEEPQPLQLGATVRDLAIWAADQRAAGRDCRAKLGLVKEWSDAQE